MKIKLHFLGFLQMIYVSIFLFGCIQQANVYAIPESWNYHNIFWEADARLKNNRPGLELPLPPQMEIEGTPGGIALYGDSKYQNNFHISIDNWEIINKMVPCENREWEEELKKENVIVQKFYDHCPYTNGDPSYKLTVGSRSFFVNVGNIHNGRNFHKEEKWILTSLLNARIVDEE